MRWVWMALPALVGCGALVRLEPDVEPCAGPSDCPERCAVDLDCDDGIACTTDRCEDESCTHEADDAACDDGAACTGVERCDETAGCVSEEVPCDDGVECTEDSCLEDENGFTCLSTPRHDRCPDGQLCRQGRDGTGCREVGCDEGCGDEDVCNGVERCERGRCVPGERLECDDGLHCTGDEVCEPRTGACLLQAPPQCPSEEPCGVGRCDLDSDRCVVDPVDELCDDEDGCTVDRCEDGGCTHDDLDCDDGNDCTTDACQDGACLGTPRDEDGDGHADVACVANGDCNDADAAVYPGADEVCNGQDDDCDGAPDQTFECVAGKTRSCFREAFDCDGFQTCDPDSCTWGTCDALPEDCGGGHDEDCDDLVDEEDPDCDCGDGDSEQCVTPCGTFGTRICDQGTWGPCTSPELCNGFDDDCDGAVDGGPCALGDVRPCGAGNCGLESCGIVLGQGDCGWLGCQMPPEQCNGLDDDCDGEADEDFGCVDGTTTGCDTLCPGGTGEQVCLGCFLGVCVPVEDCDGVDDDCDGVCDGAFECCQGEDTKCTTTCNSVGQSTCGDDCSVDDCQPPGEVCNGLDDDCDGACDGGFGGCCAFTDQRICQVGPGVQGHELCTAFCDWSKCCTDQEICGGGRDDDCDGIDELLELFCCNPTGADVEEDCDGVDDDCNGLCDDGAGECCQGAQETCVVPGCNVLGRRTCDAGCAWGACQPSPEVGPFLCGNGVDDDCDGDVDRFDPGCRIVVAL